MTIVPLAEETLAATSALHLGAFDGSLSSRLGRRYVHAFLSWFVKRDDVIAMVALMGPAGEIGGYAIGAPVGYASELNRDLAWVAVTSLLIRPWLLFDRRIWATLLARLGFVVGRSAYHTTGLPAPVMSLVTIAVAPQATGKGVGSSLIKAFEEEARRRRMASLRLSVYPGNSSARRLYERCGWHALPVPESRSGTIYYALIL